MTRKGKRAPCVSRFERGKLTSYGTITARLGTESQTRFGDCCLSLEAAKDPVATPSGHIYNREAIISYLLQKNRDLKEARLEHDARIAASQKARQVSKIAEDANKSAEFLKVDQGVPLKAKGHTKSLKKYVGRYIDCETKEEGVSTLKRTSFWLTDFVPQHESSVVVDANSEGDNLLTTPIPERPASPMSGNPLRMKDLIDLDMKRENQNEDYDATSAVNDSRFVCCVSGRALTTQEIIVIKKTKKVMTKDMYETLARPTMTCPITGRKFKEKDVLQLKKAATGFAASGEVMAKKYRPTLT